MKQHDQRWELQCMWQECAKAGEEQQLDMFLSAKEKKRFDKINQFGLTLLQDKQT